MTLIAAILGGLIVGFVGGIIFAIEVLGGMLKKATDSWDKGEPRSEA
jgi:hypothetical protein